MVHKDLPNPVDANIATASLADADNSADAVESANNEILVCPAPERKLPTAIDWNRGFDQASDFHVALVLGLSDSTDGETKLMAEYACLAFGRRAQTQSSDLLNSNWGAALREASLLTLGEADAAAAVSAEHTIAREVLNNTDTQRATNLLNYDDDLAINWFAELVANGEFAAIANLVEEAKSLSADPGYNLAHRATETRIVVTSSGEGFESLLKTMVGTLIT